jgi:hypothetical protein
VLNTFTFAGTNVSITALKVNGVVLVDYSSIGVDSSGNSNHWADNNLSIDAVTGNDSLRDSPSQIEGQTDTGVGGDVKGNYCTWNPLFNSTGTYTEGNLQLLTTAGNRHYQATFGLTSGKWYWEIEPDSGSTPGMIGIALGSKSPTANLNGDSAMSYYSVSGNKQGGNTSGVDTSYGATFTYGDIIGVALDLDSGTKTLTFYKNGVSQGVAFNPDVSLGSWFPAVSSGSSISTTTFIANFGQRAFAYTAPSGFKSLCTANLPDPTIADGSQYFDTKLWTGTGASHAITGYNFSPDMAWIKSRSNASNHGIWDIVRGTNKEIRPNTTEVERTDTDTFNSFNSDGFTLGTDSGNGDVNLNGRTFVGWAWDAGTSTVTNNNGSIASQVRAQPSAGFSVVKAPITSSGGSIGHGLNAKPGMLILKNIGSAGTNWVVWHSSFGINDYILLNSSAAEANSASLFNGNSTSTFTVGSGFAAGTNDFIAYCFAPVEGYSAFGSYTGNGSADGPFVHTGMRPAFILWKRSDSVDNWSMLDSSRSPFNVADDWLGPNSSSSESSNNSAFAIDLCSNGFKIRATHSATNASGSSYIYAAFAETPFKTARAR